MHTLYNATFAAEVVAACHLTAQLPLEKGHWKIGGFLTQIMTASHRTTVWVAIGCQGCGLSTFETPRRFRSFKLSGVISLLLYPILHGLVWSKAATSSARNNLWRSAYIWPCYIMWIKMLDEAKHNHQFAPQSDIGIEFSCYQLSAESSTPSREGIYWWMIEIVTVGGDDFDVISWQLAKTKMI